MPLCDFATDLDTIRNCTCRDCRDEPVVIPPPPPEPGYYLWDNIPEGWWDPHVCSHDTWVRMKAGCMDWDDEDWGRYGPPDYEPPAYEPQGFELDDGDPADW